MATEVKVPAAGESITSANVATWHVKTGDIVRPGDALVTLETDKVSNELAADIGGRITILVQAGEEVSIGTVIASIDESAAADAPAPAAAPATAATPNAAAAPAPVSGQVIAVKVPAAGESITSANVAKWHKKTGDFVARGETIVTLETDKVSTELVAEADGTLKVLALPARRSESACSLLKSLREPRPQRPRLLRLPARHPLHRPHLHRPLRLQRNPRSRSPPHRSNVWKPHRSLTTDAPRAAR